jgi:hypothetical protein
MQRPLRIDAVDVDRYVQSRVIAPNRARTAFKECRIYVAKHFFFERLSASE